MNRCPTCGNNIPPDAPGGLCPVCLYRIAAPQPDASPAARDRNLLFGVLGIQLRIFEAKSFIDAASAWAADPKVGVPERLQTTGVIDDQQRHMLEGLVDEAVGHFGGDPVQALDALSGKGTLSIALSAAPDRHHAEELATMLGLPPIVDDVRLDEEVPLREEPGRYTRTTPYSRGGMGQIFLVHDQYLNRDVALKELLPFGGTGKTPQTPVRASGAIAARFLREAKLTGQLEHPAIVPVYELGKRADGAFYYTMKLVRGTTFGERMGRAATLDDRLTLMSHFVDLCNAVGYAHSRSVIHRDLKPTNVLIGAFGETVLIDWGLAKVVGQEDPIEDDLRESVSEARPIEPGDPSSTKTGQLLGTPSYMSPEQARGDIPAIDARSDVFSLGIFLYELLTGRLPFKGKDTLDTVKAIQKGGAVPPRQYEARIPPELESICMKALAPKPEDRFPDAAALRDELIRFQTGAIVRTYDYSAGEMIRRFYTRHRPAVNVAALAAAALLILGAVSYINIRQSRDEAVIQRDRADFRALVSELRLAGLYVHQGHLDDATSVLNRIPVEDRHVEWAFLNSRTQETEYRIPGYDGLAVNQDGSRIATFFRDTDIGLYRAADGALIQTFAIDEDVQVGSVSFSNNADLLLALLRNGTVRIWEIATGNLIRTLEFPATTIIGASFLFSSGNIVGLTADGNVHIWQPEGPSPISSFEVGPGRPRGMIASDSSSLVNILFDDDRRQVWDTDTADFLLQTQGTQYISSADGLLALNLRDGIPEVWNVQTGELERTLLGHEGSVIRSTIAASAQRAVTLGVDMDVVVWEIESGAEIARITPRVGVNFVRISDDGRLLLLVTNSFDVLIYEVGNENPIRVLHDKTRPIMNVYVAPQGDMVWTTSFDRVIRAYNPSLAPHTRLLAGGLDAISRVSVFSGDQTIGVMSDSKNEVNGLSTAYTLYELETGIPRNQWRIPARASFRETAISSDETLTAWTSDDFAVIVSDIATGSVRSVYQGHAAPITALSFANGDQQCVTTSWDGTVHIWNVLDSAPVVVFRAHQAPIAALRPINGTNNFVTGDRLGRILKWDGTNGEIVAESNPYGVPLSAMDTNDRLIAAGFQDGAVALLDSDTLQYRMPPEAASPRTVGNLEFAEQNRLLSETNEDIVFWDTDRQQIVASNVVDVPGEQRHFPLDPTQFISLENQRLFLNRLQGETETLLDQGDVARVIVADRLRAEDCRQSFAVTTVELAALAMGGLAQHLENIDLSEGPIIVPERGSGSRVRRLGLDPGVNIVRINGMEVRETSDSIDQLRSLSQPEAIASEGLQITIDVFGTDLTIQYTVIPLQVVRQREVLDRSDLLSVLENFSDGVRRARGNVSHTTRMAEQAIGAATESGDPSAVWIGSDPSGDVWEPMTRFGLSPRDRWISVNGSTVTSVDELLDTLDEAILQVRNEQSAEWVVTLEKGEFLQYELTVAVS